MWTELVIDVQEVQFAIAVDVLNKRTPSDAGIPLRNFGEQVMTRTIAACKIYIAGIDNVGLASSKENQIQSSILVEISSRSRCNTAWIRRSVLGLGEHDVGLNCRSREVSG